MGKPELLAPGGSFLAAFYAFEAGADGVYLGLKEFSARAAAQNFSFDQLRRIRQLAADRGRRLYVAVNTVIREDEMPRLRDESTMCSEIASDSAMSSDFPTRRAPASWALAAVRLGLQAITFMSSAAA